MFYIYSGLTIFTGVVLFGIFSNNISFIFLLLAFVYFIVAIGISSVYFWIAIDKVIKNREYYSDCEEGLCMVCHTCYMLYVQNSSEVIWVEEV